MGQKRMDLGTLKPVLPQRSSLQRALGVYPGAEAELQMHTILLANSNRESY